MFDKNIFDNKFDIQTNMKLVRNNHIDWVTANAETLEGQGNRSVFSCSKATLLQEITDLNALLPCSDATLIAAMTVIPTSAQANLATQIQA